MTARTPKSVFVFDMDNTLFATFRIWGESFAQAVAALDGYLHIGEAEILNAIADNIPAKLKQSPAIVAGKDIAQTIGWIAEPLGFDAKTPAVLDIITTWQNRQKELVERPVRNMLEAIHKTGAKSVIYTDAPQTASLAALKRSALELSHIHGFYCQPDTDASNQPVGITPIATALPVKAELGNRLVELERDHKKPHPAPLNRIARDFNVKPVNMLMIGDSLATDGASAFAAHIDYIHVPFEPKNHKASALLQNRFRHAQPTWAKTDQPARAQSFVTATHLCGLLEYFKPVPVVR